MAETRTCPSGHILPEVSFQSFISLNAQTDEKLVTFHCPGGKRGHGFTLGKARDSEMFTQAEYDRLLQHAKRERAIELSSKKTGVEL